MQHQQYEEERGLLGSLCPGRKKLQGKTFYLDSVKKRSTALLLETISLLGGGVESFLHKDVSFVVTGSQEFLKQQKCTDTKVATEGTSEEAQRSTLMRKFAVNNDKHGPGTARAMACGSRGKALLEKAIRNSEKLQKSSVLANARSWGVKILYVEDVLLYLKQLTRESFSRVHKKREKNSSKQQGSHVVKVTTLRSPCLKIEDASRKYKPLHMQSMTFPTLCYLGRFSPFESPPPKFEKRTEQVENKTREKKKIESSVQDKLQTPLSYNPSPWRPRKKDQLYCECCHQPFSCLEEHLQSDQHRAFVLDSLNYTDVDQLVAEMLPGFNPNPPQQSEETLNRPPTPLSIQDVCELEPLNDTEAEHAVQALQRQGLSLSGSIYSPGQTSPSPGVSFPLLIPATPPADIQPFTADCQIHDSHPQALSPPMPVLAVEPKTQSRHSETHHLLPCFDTPCSTPDPYSLPPALSPQVPYPTYIFEPHSPYSQPPVLSPQKYTAETIVEQHTFEKETARNVCQSIPASTPFLPPVNLTNAEVTKGSKLGSLTELNDSILATNGLKCATLSSQRSHSLPQQLATAQNPKKRCRLASPEHSWTKRRRIPGKLGCSGGWNVSVKPESDIMVKFEGWLSDKNSYQVMQPFPNPETSSACAVKTLVLKQTFTRFCVPAVQNFSLAANQMDILGHGSTTVVSEQSWPLASTAKNSDPPRQFPTGTSHSSQESQCSLSHSTSVCIESALIPDLATISPSSSDSDWDCDLLSRLGPTSVAPLLPTEQSGQLNKELLHRPCTWMQDASYESRLHTVLQPPKPGTSLCVEEMDSSTFSRTLVKIVEVQH